MQVMLRNLSPARRVVGFWALALGALLVGGWLQTIDADLRRAGVGGIVALELAGDADEARRTLCAWRAEPVPDDPEVTALDRAVSSLWIDFLFLILYPATLAAGCRWAAGVFEERRLAGAGPLRLIAWGQAVAFLGDLTENVLLLWVIDRFREGEAVGNVLPGVAAGCAKVKFSLVFLAGIGVIAGLVVRALWPDSGPDPDGEEERSD